MTRATVSKTTICHGVRIDVLTSVSLCLGCMVLVILPILTVRAAEPLKKIETPPPLPGRHLRMTAVSFVVFERPDDVRTPLVAVVV